MSDWMEDSGHVICRTMEEYRRHHRYQEPDPTPVELAELRKRKEQIIIAQFDEITRYMKEGEGPKYERFGRMATDSQGGYRRGRTGASIT